MYTSISTVVDGAMSVKLSDSQIQALQVRVAELEADNQRLRKSESRYRQVFENAPISMILGNREGYATVMNAAAEALYGLSLEQFNQQACPIFDNPQLVENGTLPYMQRALAGEAAIEPPTFYDSSRGSDSGNFNYTRRHYAPIRNATGVVEGFFEIAVQYNDFFELQAQLLEEKERLARLLSTVAEVANRLLRAPDYEAVLPEVVRLLGEATGCDRCAITQDFIDSTTHQFRVRLLHEWCRDEIPSALIISPGFEEGLEIDSPPSFRSQLLQGESVNFVVSEMSELSWQNFFEDHGNTAMLLVPVMIDGHCWGHIGFDNCGEPRLHDESEVAILQVAAESIAAAIEGQAKDAALRESERRFRELFENSNDGIYFSNFNQPIPRSLPIEEQIDLAYQSFEFVNVNSACANMFGFGLPDEMIGKYLGDVHSPDSNHRNLLRHLSQNGWNVSNLESDDVDEQGNKRYWLSHLFSTIENGHLVRGWGIANNITELRQAQQALLEAEQAKSQELEILNAELRQTLTELEGRDRISEATVAATNALLTTETLDEAVNTALQIIGEALHIDRVVVLEHFASLPGSSLPGWRTLYEWDAAGTVAQLAHAQLAQGTYEGIEDWYEQLSQGQVISCLLEEMPEPFRSGQAAINVQALHAVPIFIAGTFWGSIGIDNCREAKRISEAELAVLSVAADCIGSAIQRERLRLAEQRTQQTLRQTETARAAEQARNEVLQQRDRLLNASATSVSALLTVEDLDDAINRVLKTVGEAFDTDRAGVVEFFDPEDSATSLPHWRLLYEWHTLDTPSQLADPTANQGTSDGIEDIYARLEQGDVFSAAIENCGEPFRSQMVTVGVQAMHYIPIFVEGQCWGLLGFDDCREIESRSPAELSILSIAADCLGSAIQRQRTQQTLQQTEQARAIEQARNEVLQQRDRILNATATVAQKLLASENLEKSVNEALQTLGESLDTDRLGVIENFEALSDSPFPSWRAIYEWDSDYAVSQVTHPIASQGNYQEIEGIYNLLWQGQPVSYQIEDAPESFRSAQLAISVKSTHLVPIFVEDRWWGVLGLDDCCEAKHRSSAELAVLKTAAACIGSAIQRERLRLAEQRTQQTLRQTETARAAEQARNEILQQRDRLLNASATSVSALLTVEDLDDAIDLVLKTIGEALDTDRAGVIEFFYPEDSAAALPHWRLLHEWQQSDIPSQLAHSATAQGTHDGIEDIYALLEQGNFFSTAIEDCGEPFRTQQLAIDVQAIHYVPIFVESECWGILAFDDCREVKHRSPAELSVLSIAANCVGSAIQRQRTQQTLQQTEQARAVEQARNEVLQQRDRMLTTVAEATKDLLNSSSTDLDRVIPAALRVLGEGLGCDRVNVLENFGQSATQVPGYTKVIYGWAEPDVVLQIAHPDATQIDCEGLEAFTGQYLENNGFGGLVDDWPEPLRSAFKAVNIQSSYSVPIWLGDKFWGIVSFDYCHEAKHISPAEMAILRTAAACIGGAIQRDRTQNAILQTEQAQVAKLMTTNQALKNNLDRLATESDLDAFLGYVLIEISQQLNIQTVWFYLYEPTDRTVQLHRWVDRGEVQPPEKFSQLGPMATPISVANLPIWEHLRQTKTPFVITPDNADRAEQFMFPGTQDWQLQWAQQNNIQSGINILLTLGETPLGLLGLLSAQRSEYTSEELALVQALSHQATLAIQLTRLADEAKQSTLYEERSRLAGEIHDTLAQTFTGISVQLELAQYLIGQSAKESDLSEVDSTLERISSLAQTGLAEARRSVWSLYPAIEDYANLAESLADCIATLVTGTDLHTQVSLKGEPYPLNCFVGKNLLRIGQEAITNTFKHAQATELWVELIYAPDRVSLRIGDNGCGFSSQAQAEGFGLVSISERADRIGGQLRITTQPRQGTEIFVQVPLPL